MSAGIGIAQWIVPHIAEAIEILRIERIRHDRIRLDEPAQGGIVPAAAIIV
jgi:hypothetical protein